MSDAAVTPLARGATKVVIDTNVVLDLWLYIDPRVSALRDDLEKGVLQWVATQPMREELARVLQYEHIQSRLAKGAESWVGLEQQEQEQEGPIVKAKAYFASGQFILDHMQRLAHFEEPAPKAHFVCKDGDDQKFIDLAQRHQACLISKDKAVLSMKNRMARVGVSIVPVYASASA